MIPSQYKHGESNPPTIEYRSWSSMMNRCYNSNNFDFKNYGDRGIRVCEEWHDYEKFLLDMGRKPGREYTLERKDNNGNYEPSNCEWQTRIKQARNQRKTRLTMVKAREIRMLWNRGYTARELAKEFGIGYTTVFNVLHNNTWKEEE